MDAEVADRRFHARFAPPPGAEIRATLRPGCAVTLVDVSANGALVEAPRPLRPGAKAHLQVVTTWHRFAVTAQVLRCTVWSLDPLDGVTYRGAVQFEERVDWRWGRADPARPAEAPTRQTRARAERAAPKSG